MSSVPLRPVTVLELSGEVRRRGNRLITHTLVLQDDILRRFRLPLGPCEAMGIRVVMQNELVPRPITHDLIANVLQRLGGELDSVIIQRTGNSYIAKVTVKINNGTYSVEGSYGDAVALALRTGTTIFATEEVIVEESAAGE